MSYRLENEVFAARDEESWSLTDKKPESGNWIAVQARSVAMPEGTRTESAAQIAIIACYWSGEPLGWRWLQLSAPTKQFVGDMLTQSGAEHDRWCYIIIN